MAENLDDGEFWLPPQFLTDFDDASFEATAKTDAVSRTLVPYFSSSSETESDEEEHLAELTRQLARSTLASENPKGVFGGGGSPQSTLSAFGSSGKGSSPDGVVSQESATWDLLRAAAGEVERMRLGDDRYRYRYLHGYGYDCDYGFVRNDAVKACGGVNAAGVGVGFYSQPHQNQQQSFSQQQLQIAQFEMMRQQQQQQQRQMVLNRGRNNNNNNNVRGLSGSAWPPPMQNGSGMRAVFLAGNRESAGTGVFLPRSVETRTESRKKPGCKTVLVPDRVAQALNLNLEGVMNGHLQQQQHHHQQNPRFNGSAVPRARSNNNNNNYHGVSHQKRNNPKPQPQVVKNNHEIHLPQEWTY
ncbi:uncharacterized protein LOC109812577 [Cajanus cajan]|uniref:Uncharacterized protein n=1 Tax=Cajanus cajan TaxID=3821 RepID=A0A151S6R2_CAJCA|nr:uncharacterized protein LOC109812577 [Cajanus cajan]KYP50510.1 hypothetical protein KK1_027666 [Cajanus cajan]